MLLLLFCKYLFIQIIVIAYCAPFHWAALLRLEFSFICYSWIYSAGFYTAVYGPCSKSDENDDSKRNLHRLRYLKKTTKINLSRSKLLNFDSIHWLLTSWRTIFNGCGGFIESGPDLRSTYFPMSAQINV